MKLRSHGVLRYLILALVSLTISTVAWGQHKNDSEKPSEHASKPSHPSSQPSHGSTPNRSNPPSQRPPASRPPENRGTPAARPGNRPESNPGNRPGNVPSNRGVNTPANRGGNTPGNRGANASGNRVGNRPGDRVGSDNRGANMPGTRGNVAGNRTGRPAPGRTVSLKGGGSARIGANGKIRSINRNGMQIHNNLRGGRVIVNERNGARIVTTGRGRGYVQRAYVTRGGRSYYSRTYYDHGVYRVGIYRGYYYRGYRYYGYYPAYWYRPGFYGWAYNPWGPGIYWGVGFGGWGWAGSPWWGYYGGWFTPYPVYPSAAFWLTDYLIAANLQSAYASQSQYADSMEADAQSSANYNNGGQQSANSEPVTLAPEVKQAIAEEVKAQLEQQQQQSQQGGGQAQAAPANDNQVPPALDPARRTFVVASDITVTSDGDECELTAGDVITRLTETPDENQYVTASVSASKKKDCAAGKTISISVDALQDMHNHFQEQLNNGMKALAEKQGTGGLPKAPDTGTVNSDVPPPDPDKNVETELNDQEKAADQAESQAQQDADSGPSGDQQPQ